MLLGDIEIKLLRARLEQTEKTLQTVLAQMATINNPLNKPKLNGKKVKNEFYKKNAQIQLTYSTLQKNRYIYECTYIVV